MDAGSVAVWSDTDLDQAVSLAAKSPLVRKSAPSPTTALDARVLAALTRGDRDELSRLGTPTLDTSLASKLKQDLDHLRPEYLRSTTTERALAVVYGLSLVEDGGSTVVHELVLVYVGGRGEEKLARIVNIGW
ncbi:MAG: hypothetical protein U0263_39290 [Polyangiaceae bacterium]